MTGISGSLVALKEAVLGLVFCPEIDHFPGEQV